MDNIPGNIGSVIRNVRQEADMSLDKASQLTGVSKAMLSKIEKGQAQPTISTLWKIASGLRISLSRLLSSDLRDYRAKSLSEITQVLEDEGRMILHNIFPFDPITGFDYLYISLLPGCDYSSPTHTNVFEEYIVVTQGKLILTIEGKEYVLDTGDSIRFKGDCAHGYANPYGEKAIFQNVIKYF